MGSGIHLFMRYSHLLSLMEEADLSPEQLAKRLGISGMTVRRWQRQPGNKELPKLYEKSLVGVIQELVTEGKLPPESPAVKAVIAEEGSWTLPSSVDSLGITQNMLQEASHNPKHLVESLSQLGANEDKKTEVDQHKKKILSFRKMGAEWSTRISSLMRVLESSELHTFDKLVAYGALFYLLCPFDLIPDYIPVFGYMDDFIVLGFAVAYYVKRFPHLFNKSHVEA
jgi:uncharacterized membrane protein YkvA (DUF1232 family)